MRFQTGWMQSGLFPNILHQQCDTILYSLYYERLMELSQIGGPLSKEKEAECRQAGWTGGKGGGTGGGGLIYFFK